MNDDDLDMFRAIANECDYDECVLIMEDCLESDSEIMRTSVYEIYKSRLRYLKDLEDELEYYEYLSESGSWD